MAHTFVRTCVAVALVGVVLAGVGRDAGADVRCEPDHVVIDGATIRFGDAVVVVGRCVEQDHFDLDPGVLDVEVVRLDGRANQDKIVLRLSPPPAGGGNRGAHRPGDWIWADVVVADGKASGPRARLSETARRIGPAAPAPLTIGDFVGRPATFEGTAAAGDALRVDGEWLHVAAWPPEVVGKRVGVRATVRRVDGQFRAENPAWQLLDLADLAGKRVTLPGRLWSLNDVWWFDYRGERVVVTDARDRPFKWKSDRHGSPARATGLLVRQLRPSLEQISLKTDRDLVPTYVLRRATIEYAEPPVDVDERFRTIFPTGYKVADGVPVLIAEGVPRQNIMGDESKALDYFPRNEAVIGSVLRPADAKTLDVLAKRLSDPAVDPAMRLVYAAMLAAANDDRGRAFLARAADRRDDDFPSILCALGAFAGLMPDDAKTKTSLAWAEPVLTKLMTERDAAGRPRGAGRLRGRAGGPADELLPSQRATGPGGVEGGRPARGRVAADKGDQGARRPPVRAAHRPAAERRGGGGAVLRRARGGQLVRQRRARGAHAGGRRGPPREGRRALAQSPRGGPAANRPGREGSRPRADRPAERPGP